jgi:hypothetical protein
MSFQWLQMRIGEEKERREREATIRERLPRALEELHRELSRCIESYTEAFGAEACTLSREESKLRLLVRTEIDGKWQPQGEIEITTVLALPGFQVDRGGESLIIQVGLLPGERVSYMDRTQDQYLNMEDLTRRILDRAFFPNLKEQ